MIPAQLSQNDHCSGAGAIAPKPMLHQLLGMGACSTNFFHDKIVILIIQ